MHEQQCVVASSELEQFASSRSSQEDQVLVLPFTPMNGFCSPARTSGNITRHSASPHLQTMHGCLAPSPHNIASLSTTADTPNHCNNNKRKRRPAGTPDPDAEVVSLSPKTLMESDRYVCEICNQGFQRDQNLQMHRRRHKVPWKLLKRSSPEIRKRVYVCPEPSCLHHDPCHALGDLVGIKKHYRRKHSTDKQWKCEKCAKGYAVQSDYKAHLKTCGTRGHCCDCGHVFSRVESFIEHQDNCSIAKEKAAVGSSDQTSLASLSTRNGSPSRSADNISVTTWSGVSTSGVIRSLESRFEPAWLIDQQELQLLPTDPSTQNLLSDRPDLIMNKPTSAATAATESRYVQASSRELTAPPRLQLSIGLPSHEKSNYDSRRGFDFGVEDKLVPSEKKSQAVSAAEVSQKGSGASREDHHGVTLSCSSSHERERRPWALKDLLTHKKQVGDLEPARLQHKDDMRHINTFQLMGSRSFGNDTESMQRGHDEHGQYAVDQDFPRLLSSRHIKLGLHVEPAAIDTSEQAGFDILNFRPWKQSKLQQEVTPEADPQSAGTQSLHIAASKQMEVIMAVSKEVGQSWNPVSREISTSLSDIAIARRTKEDARHEWEKAENDLARAELLQLQAREQLKLAGQAREMARRQLELAEAELANAKRVREHAEAELASAQMFREQATRRIDATRLEATCQACRQQFQYQVSTSSLAAAPVAWTEQHPIHQHHLISSGNQQHENEHGLVLLGDHPHRQSRNTADQATATSSNNTGGINLPFGVAFQSGTFSPQHQHALLLEVRNRRSPAGSFISADVSPTPKLELN